MKLHRITRLLFAGLMSVAAAVGSTDLATADDGIDVLGLLEGSFGEIPIGSIIEVAAGPYHALVLTDDGVIRAAGRNGPIDFETGNPCGQCDPPDGLVDVRAVAAGTRHSMALLTGGSVVCWGCDEPACDVPPELAGGKQGDPLDPAVAIAAGDRFSLALLESGAIACWGAAIEDEVCEIPQEAQDPSNPAVRILAQGTTCVAILQDGTIITWGGAVYWPGDNLPENANIVDATISPQYDTQNTSPPSLAVLLADGRYVDAGGILTFDELNPCEAIFPGPSTVILLADGRWEFRGDVSSGSFPIPGDAGSTRPPVSMATGGRHYLITIPLPADCDQDGVPDHEEIAMDPNLDCDGDGRLDACRPASHWFEGGAIAAEGVDLDLSELPFSEVPVVVSVEATGDLDALNEFLIFDWNGGAIATAFGETGSQEPCEARTDDFWIDPRIWNQADADGHRVLTVSPSLSVDPDACANSGFDITFALDASPPFRDCNGNGIEDDCEIADGLVPDVDGDQTPDECQPDCDQDGLPDAWTIFEGIVLDCNENGIPESCDVESGNYTDCDGNGEPDSCQIKAGEIEDCDGDFVPDACAIAEGLALDCNANGVPDACDLEWPGSSSDQNWNGIPDECELARGDLDLDGCVGAADLGQLLALWGLNNPPIGDLDGDGVVRAGDLGILLSNWNCP